MKRIVVGFGTGRCGTKSLAHFLNRQPNVTVTHEKLPSMFPQWGNYMDYITLLLKQPTFIVGNVAYAWIEYIDRLFMDLEDVRVICLDRNDDEEVAESFWSYLYDANQFEYDPRITWPYFSSEVSKERIKDALYIYKYKQRVLLAQHPQILHVFTSDLNDRFKQKEILEHIGIKEEDMVLKMTRENKREDMKLESK